jgi:hypothetical protein
MSVNPIIGCHAIVTSTDGITWQPYDTSFRFVMWSAVWNGRAIMAAGQYRNNGAGLVASYDTAKTWILLDTITIPTASMLWVKEKNRFLVESIGGPSWISDTLCTSCNYNNKSKLDYCIPSADYMLKQKLHAYDQLYWTGELWVTTGFSWSSGYVDFFDDSVRCGEFDSHVSSPTGGANNGNTFVYVGKDRCIYTVIYDIQLKQVTSTKFPIVKMSNKLPSTAIGYSINGRRLINHAKSGVWIDMTSKNRLQYSIRCGSM